MAENHVGGAPEKLTLRADGIWVGASGKNYMLTFHDRKSVWVELDDAQTAVRVAKQATGED